MFIQQEAVGIKELDRTNCLGWGVSTAEVQESQTSMTTWAMQKKQEDGGTQQGPDYEWSEDDTDHKEEVSQVAKKVDWDQRNMVDPQHLTQNQQQFQHHQVQPLQPSQQRASPEEMGGRGTSRGARQRGAEGLEGHRPG